MHPVPIARVQGRILGKLPVEVLVDPVQVREVQQALGQPVGVWGAAPVGSKAEPWPGFGGKSPRNHFERQGI